MTNYYIYPFKYDCDNALMLKRRLSAQRIKLVDSKYKYKEGDVVVNWGNSKCPNFPIVVNNPRAVGFAVDKLVAFDLLRNAHLRTVPITRSRAVAKRWLEQGAKVLGRSLIKGNNGAGITFFNGENCQDAKFYSQFIKGIEEYRVNVYRDKLLSIRVKRRNPNLPLEEFPIKSGLNGYFFKEPVGIHGIAVDLARDAISELGLDFGGVDVIVEQHNEYILEVNTAPELQGAAMDRLAEYIKKDYGN